MGWDMWTHNYRPSDVIGIQETRRDGQSSLIASVYSVRFSGVGMVIEMFVEVGKEDCEQECISDQLMKFNILLPCSSGVVVFIVGYAPTEPTGRYGMEVNRNGEKDYS
ncbi:unnamed protein product [Choristocarpus tenellus]